MTVSWHEPFFMWSQFPDRGQTPFTIERKRSALRFHYCTENDTFFFYSYFHFSFYVQKKLENTLLMFALKWEKSKPNCNIVF